MISVHFATQKSNVNTAASNTRANKDAATFFALVKNGAVVAKSMEEPNCAKPLNVKK
jgi:hypothetical protein